MEPTLDTDRLPDLNVYDFLWAVFAWILSKFNMLRFVTFLFAVCGGFLFLLRRINNAAPRARPIRRRRQSAQQNASSCFPFIGSRLKIRTRWEDLAVVGRAYTFSIQAYSFLHPTPSMTAEQASSLRVNIEREGQNVTHTVLLENDEFLVTFIVHKAGKYDFKVFGAGFSSGGVRGESFTCVFLPGEVDASHSELLKPFPVRHVLRGETLRLLLMARDEYGNDTCPSDIHVFSCGAVRIETETPAEDFHVEKQWLEFERRVELLIQLGSPGLYRLQLQCYGRQLVDSLIVCVIEENALKSITDTLKKRHNVYYEATLLKENGAKDSSCYCYVSTRRITLRTYFLKIFFANVVWGSRYSKSLKVLASRSGRHWRIELHCKGLSPARFLCSQAPQLLTALSVVLQQRSGLSDSYDGKKSMLTKFVRDKYSNVFNTRTQLTIDRNNLLSSSMRETKGFKAIDWAKKFYIIFEHEAGLDYGGPYREWFSLLSAEIFNPAKSTLFCKLSDRNVVHPAPSASSPSQYEFCGQLMARAVVRQLQDSSHPALGVRLSRSFLAQLLGLSVTHEFFAADDPDFFRTKIQYILENDPQDLDLNFTEDIFDSSGNFLKTVELIRRGASIPVTVENRLRYVRLLTELRLSSRIKEQVHYFRKGFFSVIAEDALEDWDENELELLVCGFTEISVSQLQAHCEVRGAGCDRLRKTLNWFWAVLSEMTQEQLGQLMQFVTGSALLPSGGVAALEPCFCIQLISYNNGHLPCAHTCFNRIDLYEYEDMAQLHRCLLTAIQEGGTGFALS